jgi:hypothetical protein
MPGKDFDFFRKFEEILIFLINSLVYSPLESQDSLVMNIYQGSQPELVYEKPAGAKKIHQKVKIPLSLIRWGVFTPRSIC